MKIRRMAIGAALAVVTLIPVAAAVPAQAAPAATPQAAARCTISVHRWFTQPRTSKARARRDCGHQIRALFLGRFPAGNHWVFGGWHGDNQTSTAFDSFARHVIFFGYQERTGPGGAIHTHTWAT